MAAHRPASVVDLGCSAGRGLGHLLRACSPGAAPALFVGVDRSAHGLRLAARRLSSLAPPEGEAAAGAGAAAPRAALLLGSLDAPGLGEPGGWGGLGGAAGLALALELIEHLDPAPLAAFGAALLGGLRPAVALVTTPNAEYNPVLRQAGAWGGAAVEPGALRDCDHRFEWTRAEFEAHCRGLAAVHGYDVTFDGIGHAVAEAAALAALGRSPADVGAASQAAIFVRRGGEPAATTVELSAGALPRGAALAWGPAAVAVGGGSDSGGDCDMPAAGGGEF